MAMKHVARSTASADDIAEGACDLAVAMNPDRDTLQAAWQSLRPGGTCYTEWYLPSSGGIPGVRKQLTLAGFEDITLYWAWPWPSRSPASFWIPMDSPQAVQFFLANRPQKRRIREKVHALLLRSLWTVMHRTGWLLPVCAVARVPGRASDVSHGVLHSALDARGLASADEPPSRSLDVTLKNIWQTQHGNRAPHHLSKLLITGGLWSVNKVIGLIFADQENDPFLVLKMSRVPESIPRLRHEALVLSQLESLGYSSRLGIPKPMLTIERNGVLMVGQTAMPGRPMDSFLNDRSYRDLALRGTEWLVKLAGETKPTPASEWWPRVVEPVLSKFEHDFDAIAPSHLVSETRSLLEQLGPLPMVCEHRDFAPVNIHLDHAQELMVLDWELAELHGLPGMDLMYFLTCLSLLLQHALPHDFHEAYRDTFNPATPVGRVVDECLALYCERLQIDRSTLRPLRNFVWMLHALHDHERLSGDAEGVPTDEALRSSLFFCLWELDLQVPATLVHDLDVG